MKNFFFILLFYLFWAAPCIAQYNLVPNSSFENYTACPTLNDFQNGVIPPWFVPHPVIPMAQSCWGYGSETPDYCNSCETTGGLGVPNNSAGYEPARSGNAYAGIFTMNLPLPEGSEYIEVGLIDSLKQDEQYVVSFYVSLADQVKYATNKIGMYFSDTAITYTCDTPLVLPFTPQIVNTSANPLTNKNGWTLVTDTLTAMGGEKYMIIGNFFPLSQSDTVYVGGTGWGGCCSYYYIDDVSVIPLDSLITQVSSPIHPANNVHLYPNPNSGHMTLAYSLAQGEQGELLIFDLTGRTVARYHLSSESNALTITEEMLAIGTYLYKVMINDKMVKAEKLVIIK